MSLVTFPRQFLVDANGSPRVGAKMHVYAAGTTTPITVYTTAAYAVAHSNPVLSVSGGLFPAVYVNSAVNSTYKLLVTDSADVTVYSEDNIPALTLSQSEIEGTLYPQTAIELAQSVTPSDTSIPDHTVLGYVVPQRYFPAASPTTAQMLTALTNAWDVALAAECDLYCPAGEYDIGDANMPWRQVTASSLLDCKNITIHGEGPSTIFKTSSADGADVMQLNGVKNLHIRNCLITADLSATNDSGSNGISVTGGWDNLTILDVWMENLPSVDATTNVDGGKALSVQPSTTTNECGTLKARIFVKGCAGGFDYTPDLVTAAGKKTAIEVDIVAEDCYRAVVIGSPAASAAIDSDMCEGVRVRGQAINCQRDVDIVRAHGVDVEMQVITTKTAAARRLDSDGVAWIASDTTVEALHCLMGHHSKIVVRGDKGECDYKARIGGTNAGSSGLNGGTVACDISLDIAGTAATGDVESVDSGGNTMSSSRLVCTTNTDTALPTAFSTSANNNRLQVGFVERGSFTGTLTGCTTSPTGTVEYSIEGDLVTLEVPAISGTSNTTAATITGMSDIIKPTATQTLSSWAIDNGVTVWSRIFIGTDGTITLNNGYVGTFTGSGTKGIQPISVTYRKA